MPENLREALQSLLGPSFELRRELGGGGMSRVFVAHEPALKRDVVVKVLPTDLFSTKSAERFQREVETTARLQHPHILPVVTAGGSARLRYYVVPYIAGGSLRDRLDSGDRPAFEEATTLIGELLAAVAFAHERGIVHRDIKPANVLIAEGHAVLADFGIAQAVAAAQAADGLVESSVAPPEAYLAPERPTDTAADLFAVAALSHELLTGTLAAAGVGSADVFAALRQAHPNVDVQRLRSVADALARALSIAPTQRFAHASELRAALLRAGSAATRLPTMAWAGGSVLAATAIIAMLALGDPREAPNESAAVASLPIASDTAAAPAQLVGPSDDSAAAPEPRPAPTPRDIARERFEAALASAWSWSAPEQNRATQSALAALAEPEALDAVESSIARGIVALGRREFAAACEAFAAARAAREHWAAWMGAAECQTRDSAVVADAEGTLEFRSSLYAAAVAYREAGRLATARDRSLAYSRLPHVLFTDAARVRRGYGEDGRVVLGQPIAIGDSIGFEAFVPGPRRRTPESMAATDRAIAIARGMLRPALIDWIAADAANVRARELMLELLEASGNVRDAGPDGLTALETVREARALPAEREQGLRLARAHVRLLLRSGEYEAAARVADSTLLRHPDATDAEAELLLSLAMLTGKVDRATQLLEQVSGGPGRQLQIGNGRVLDVPASAYRARAEFFVAGTLGVCSEEVRSAPARLAAMVDAMFPDGQRPPGAEGAFMERPMLLALPCLGVASFQALRDPASPIARALAAPGGEGLSRAIGTIEAMRRARQGPGGPGFESTEAAMTEAQLYLLHGDTSQAIAALDRALGAVPVMPNVFLHTEILAGSLSRAVALRAELALARGDVATARRWSAAAAALWANADAELRQTAQRLSAAGGGD